MQTIELKNEPEMKRLILAAFPGYKKHRAFLSTFHGGITLNSYWDGGSRDEYAIVDRATMRRKLLPTSTHPYFDVAKIGVHGENEFVSIDTRGNITLNQLPAGYALIAAGTFCGKAATAHVYLAPVPELTETTV